MSLLALAELRLADFRLVAPYAFAMAVVPTIACAAGAEHPPPWPIITLSHCALLRHFTHHAGTDRWWTLLTSLSTQSAAFAGKSGRAADCRTPALDDSRSRGFCSALFRWTHCCQLNTAGSRKALENYLNASTGQLALSLIPAAARVVSLATGLLKRLAPPQACSLHSASNSRPSLKRYGTCCRSTRTENCHRRSFGSPSAASRSRRQC